MQPEYPCFGLQILGMCSYNPADPPISYFNIGNAISALGFALAIQQLLKPIYQFRLRANGIQYYYLVIGIFAGFLAVVIAALLPNLPVTRSHFMSYPIVWELFGGTMIAGVYAVAAYIVLRPARLWNLNTIPFCRAAAALLAQGTNEDRVKFAPDLGRNVVQLVKIGQSWEIARNHAVSLEFERLRESGAELIVSGQPPISAFYEFAHEKELKRASFACSLFRLLSDEKFCSALVTECPWDTATIVSQINDKKLHLDEAAEFIQELARQAIVNDESMVAREVGYTGFNAAPLLSDILFGRSFILRVYHPFEKLRFESQAALSSAYIDRLNGVAKLAIKATIDDLGYWDVGHLFDLKAAYETVSRQIGWSERNAQKEFPEVSWQIGIEQLYEMVRDGLEGMEPRRRKELFSRPRASRNDNLASVIAEIMFDSLEAVSHPFGDKDNRFWSHCIGIAMNVFPFHDSEPAGMDAIQQQLATMLIEKLRENMQGWYPPISKVLLAVIGPYDSHPKVKHRTAFVILKDAMYRELKNLSKLHSEHADRFSDFLPSTVHYDSAENALTHTYSNGTTATTRLAELDIPSVDLSDEANWRF